MNELKTGQHDGLLIWIVPHLLNYIVAIYLIITGLLSLFGNGGSFHLR
jgi:hypothetical protein